ncbi:MAG TPA: RDD family protein [Intrasporangiaceae bacterium]|nr:RDD family protein [Intrasporangiaceae bacterium]
MTDGPATPPRPDRAGWFDDPENSEQLRYFDGILWTDHVTPRRTIWSPSEAASDGSTVGGSTAGEQPAAPHSYPPVGHSSDGPFGYPPVQRRDDRAGRPPHTHQQGPHSGGGHYGPPAQQWGQVGNGPTIADGTPLASVGARIGAWILDSLITWTLGLILGGYLLWRGLGNYPDIVAEALRSGVVPDTAALADQIRFDLPWMGAFAVLQMLIGVGYHTVFLSRSGATPGKQIAGISVRRVDRAGVLSAADALRRSMLRPVLWLFTYTPLLSLFALPLSIMDALLGLWDPKRQTLHDKLGGTVVVRGRQPRPTRDGATPR